MNPVFVLLLLSIPALSLWMGQNQKMNTKATSTVAVYQADEDPVAANTVENLKLQGEEFIVVECASQEEVKHMVSCKEAECGYIFQEDITRKIGEGAYSKLVQGYRRESSVFYQVLNEKVFAAFFHEFSEVIMMNYVEGNEKFQVLPQEVLEGLKKGYEEEFSADTTFHVEYSLLSGEVIEEEVMTLPVRNLLAVLMFLGVFLGIYDYRKGEENGTFRTMSPSMTRMVAGMYLCIPILLLGVDTFFSILALGESEGILQELLALGLYMAELWIVGCVGLLLIRRSTTVLSILPMAAFACLILCPVFVDLSSYIRVLGLVRKFLPPTWYILGL